MTDKPADGGPAFPVLHSIDGNWVKDPLPEFSGMSLRDYFAGQALSGIGNWTPGTVDPWDSAKIRERRAAWAYAQADAMLAARTKEAPRD